MVSDEGMQGVVFYSKKVDTGKSVEKSLIYQY